MGFLRNIGGVEWIVIIAIILLVFGGSLVKGIAKRAGETTKEIKKDKDVFEKAAKEGTEENTKG
jgi:Sec-independent protein translocase protein TatA